MSNSLVLTEQSENEKQSPQPNGLNASAAPVPLDGNSDSRAAHWASDEALALVRRIFLLQAGKPPQVVMFAGIDHGSGCSGICRAVAEALAKQLSGPVCILEANFRSPALPAMFGTANHYGLTNALQQEEPIRSFAKRVGSENLWLISSGALAEDSPNLLTPDRLRTRMAEMRAEFDFVIIDAPPLTRYSDAIAVAQFTDGLVLVLEAKSTRKEAAQTVAASLRSSNIPILAAVLNKRTFPIPEKIYKRL
jgi:Mrp family chromosome partitioning ATPase